MLLGLLLLIGTTFAYTTKCTVTVTSTTTSTFTATVTVLGTVSPSILPIVTQHNMERRLTNLSDLSWDSTLSSLATGLSNSLASRGCALEHDITGASRQNLYAVYGTNVSRAIEMWIDEKALVGKPGVTFEEIGHYLNIVASDISLVGCGWASNSSSNCAVVTCNYA